MPDYRRLTVLFGLAATMLLAACGSQGLPTAPDDYDGYDDYDPGSYASPSPWTDDETPTPDPTPSASPTPSVPAWDGPPNDYRRTIGKGYLTNWLSAPRGLAVAGNLLFVADGNRPSLRGTHGAVLAFDGASEDAFTAYAGMYYERRNGSSTTFMLGSGVEAVAVTDSLVLASDAQGVKGFIRAIPENAVLGGTPIAPPCRDMAIVGGVLYMAQAGQVAAIKEGTWEAAQGLNLDARGLGADAQGRLWTVTSDRISAYQGTQRVLDFDARGTDGTGPGAMQLQDVAVDPRNGDVYALDQGRVLRFDSAGRYLASFGAGRIGQGSRIAVGADGSVYVSDAQDGEVYQYRPGN